MPGMISIFTKWIKNNSAISRAAAFIGCLFQKLFLFDELYCGKIKEKMVYYSNRRMEGIVYFQTDSILYACKDGGLHEKKNQT